MLQSNFKALSEEEVTNRIKGAHDKCQQDPATAVDEAAFAAYRTSKGQGEEPANLGPHDLCVSKALGWQNADGSVNEAYLRERISLAVHDSAKVDQLVAECKGSESDEIAIARNLFKCFGKHAQQHLRHQH